MIKSSEDIQKKEFSTVLNGFSKHEVDDYLDEIIDFIDELETKLENQKFEIRNRIKQFDELRLENERQRSEIQKLMHNMDRLEAEKAKPIPESPLFASQQLLIETNGACAKVLLEAQKRAEQMIELARSSAGSNEAMKLELRKKQILSEIDFLTTKRNEIAQAINDMLFVKMDK